MEKLVSKSSFFLFDDMIGDMIALRRWDVHGLLWIRQTSLQGGGWAGVCRAMVKKRGLMWGYNSKKQTSVWEEESGGVMAMVWPLEIW